MSLEEGNSSPVTIDTIQKDKTMYNELGRINPHYKVGPYTQPDASDQVSETVTHAASAPWSHQLALFPCLVHLSYLYCHSSLHIVLDMTARESLS